VDPPEGGGFHCLAFSVVEAANVKLWFRSLMFGNLCRFMKIYMIRPSAPDISRLMDDLRKDVVDIINRH
jgi:hypothetical protein